MDMYIEQEWIDYAKSLGREKTAEQAYNVGEFYSQSNDLDNAVMAFNSYYLAAKQGNTEAQFMLGYYYEHGIGTDIDYYAALQWYKKAAEAHHPKAQYEASWFYKDGIACTVDEKKSIKYLREAAAANYAPAITRLGICYFLGKEVRRNTKHAFDLFMRSACMGEPLAMANTGICYYYGNGVKKSFENAIYWFYEAANRGNGRAAYFIGTMLLNGEGIQKDIESAVKFFKVALCEGVAKDKIFENLKIVLQESENIEAHYLISLLYALYYYKDNKNDYKDICIEHLLRAAHASHIEACYFAGLYYDFDEDENQRIDADSQSLQCGVENEKTLTLPLRLLLRDNPSDLNPLKKKTMASAFLFAATSRGYSPT